MHWNYRVIRQKDPISGDYSYQVHEVFYNEELKPFTCTAEAVTIYGESVDELKEDLEKFFQAFERPVLDMEYFDKLELERDSDDYYAPTTIKELLGEE